MRLYLGPEGEIIEKAATTLRLLFHRAKIIHIFAFQVILNSEA